MVIINNKYKISNRVLSIEEINKIYEIDKVVYPKEYQSSIEQILERVSANSDCFTVVELGDCIIGYIAYFPITDILKERIISGELTIDSDIKSTDITKYTSSTNLLYIISLAVIPEYQGTNVVKDLMIGFKQRIHNLKDKGINIKDVITIPISEKGYNTLLKMDFINVVKI